MSESTGISGQPELAGEGGPGPAAGVVAESEAQLDPVQLRMHWQIYAQTGQWDAAEAIAEGLVAAFPDDPAGWLYRALAAKMQRRFFVAWKNLLPAARRFPCDWKVAYTLACCVCELGDLRAAWQWLDRAILLGDADLIKSAALDEPHLRPLWARLGQANPQIP